MHLKRTLHALVLLIGSAVPGAFSIPAIPEPGVVFYGNVRSSTNNQVLPIIGAVFQISDTNGNTVSLNGTTNPPVRIVTINGLSYYIARVPFNTRAIGPAGNQTLFDLPPNSFELRTSSLNYTRQATINGKSATFANSAQATFSLSAAERGRFEQVDFVITPDAPTSDYPSWAAGYFGNSTSPDAQQGADPDGDGLTNAQEYAAGTSPIDPLSALKTIMVEPLSNGGFRMVWKSAAGRIYTIEKSTDPQLQVWSQIGAPITANGDTSEFTDTSAGNDTVAHYRIRATR